MHNVKNQGIGTIYTCLNIYLKKGGDTLKNTYMNVFLYVLHIRQNWTIIRVFSDMCILCSHNYNSFFFAQIVCY
jgi:hypothetical protein